MSILNNDKQPYSLIQILMQAPDQGVVFSAREVPVFPYYVTVDDRFIGGWGPMSGRRNILIFCCESKREAHCIARYIRQNREEMTVLSITQRDSLMLLPPHGYEMEFKPQACPVWQWKTRTEMPFYFAQADALAAKWADRTKA